MNVWMRKCSDKLRKLQERELRLQKVTGFSIDQIIELFLAGYTLAPLEVMSVKEAAHKMEGSGEKKANDTISRAWMLNAFEEADQDVIADYGPEYGSEFGYSRNVVRAIINNAPSAHQQVECAEWIPAKDNLADKYCKCSHCGKHVKWHERSNYCPKCGRKMRWCIYKTVGGCCRLHSDSFDTAEPCLDGPCCDERFEEEQDDE